MNLIEFQVDLGTDRFVSENNVVNKDKHHCKNLGRRRIYFWIWNLYTPSPQQDIIMFESDTTRIGRCLPRFGIHFWVIFSVALRAWISS